MWAAHDDSWADNWLEVLIDNLRPEDIGVRGGLLLVSDDKVVAKKTLPNYQQRNFIRCFLGNETNFRSHYAYSLFFREKLLATSLETLTLSYYPDALFVYCLLEQGSLRTIPGTHIRYRLHPENLGLEYSSQWKGWRKVLYRIHPFRYYIYYLRYTNNPFTWLSIAALIPVKHVYAQISFWCRGFQQIITARIRN